MEKLAIGQKTADGIYIGQYESKSLGKIFNVFAAPANIGKYGQAYNLTRERLARLKNWHGFDGTDYANAEQFQEALKNGSYKGGWIIPTMEMLRENLSHIKDALMKVDLHNDWYWSSTEDSVFKGHVYAQRLWDGYDSYNHTASSSHCRPVRLVPVAA